MAFATHQSSYLVEVRTWWGGVVVGHVVWEVVMVWSFWSSVSSSDPGHQLPISTHTQLLSAVESLSGTLTRASSEEELVGRMCSPLLGEAPAC